MGAEFDVFGFGNALVDILVQVDEAHIEEFNLTKGGFNLVEESRMKAILRGVKGRKKKIVPAGSCANTIFALAALGANVVLCGKIGDDKHGRLYEEIVLKDKVGSKLRKSPMYPTGTVVNLVTPDGERTFAVNLGAAMTLRKEELLDVESEVTRSEIFHTEGYVLENTRLREAAVHLIEVAKKGKVTISIDLSDPGIISRNLEAIREIVHKYADIVFLNEEEARTFTGNPDPEMAVREIAEMCGTAVVKLGANGSLVMERGSAAVLKIYPVKANAIDTTGAGDFYAAGFLYGLSKGKDLRTCGTIGSIIAAKVVEQIGARPPTDLKHLPALKGLL
jgi:sugar/nucleoside kinase (ribokinase family)